MVAALSSLKVQGFRSIESLNLDLSSNVTLLVGANGSGKSNIIDAFELLGRIVDGSLQSHLLRHGGMAAQLHRSATGQDAHDLVLEAWSQSAEFLKGGKPRRVQNGYEARLRASAGDEATLYERTFTHQVDHYPEPYDVPLGAARESQLPDVADEHPATRYLLEALTGCRVFHFDDTSPDAPPLRRVSVADDLTLHDDARNLAAVLLTMQTDHPMHYRRIVRSVRNVAPFFDDFVLKPSGEDVILRWREKGLDTVFSGNALSSGTLRFICLATLLQQPEPPATIVLDEPELGLHPFAIHQLADLLQSAGEQRRIVVATQSVTLLSQFSIEDVAVVERMQGATTVSRLDSEALEAWLDDYSVGDLWEMNLLGGRPHAHGRERVGD